MTEALSNLFIPSSYSRIIAREVGLQERDLPQLLQGTTLSRDILLPGDETRITGTQQLQVIENARRITGAPEFGLRLGRQLQPSAFGPLGYLALSSPDLVTSLEALRDFLPARIPLIQLEVSLEPRWLRCTMTLRLDANADEQRVLQESFVMVIQCFVESVLGMELDNARIELKHRKPDYHKLYGRYLHSPVRFGRTACSYLVPATLARVANASGDPGAYSMAHELCQRLMEQVPLSALTTSDRVRRLLLSQPAGAVTEVDVARALFISKRTLARRLEAEGKSYRAIREQLMSELAARHLQESSLTVEAVAALLGYNDTAAFRKAFRRWYDKTPGEFRRSGYT